MNNLKTTERFGINLLTNLLPAPLAAIIQTIDECKSEIELSKQFEKLKNDLNEYHETTWLPLIPYSIETEHASVAIIYFLKEITAEQAKKIKEFMVEMEIIKYWNETSCDKGTLCIHMAEPLDKDTIKVDFVNPVIEMLKDEFNIIAKAILYA